MKSLDLKTIDLTGTHLIEASAGTGKTYTIASLFLRLLLQARLPIEGILVVTYTVPATDELKTRIREKLRQAHDAFSRGTSDDDFLTWLIDEVQDREGALRILDDALSRFDEAAISTIHGFCQRMLRDLAFETGSAFATELVTDQADLIAKAADDFYRDNIVRETVPELVSYCMERKVTPEYFMGLARQRNLAATIIPRHPKPPLEPYLGAFRQAFDALSREWTTCRDEVECLLCDTETLKQNIYKPSKMPELLEEMDRFLASGCMVLPVSESLEKFTPASLEKGTKKDKTVPCHSFFNLCQVMKEAGESLTGRMNEYLTWLKVSFLDYLDQSLARDKERQGLIHYDDLLLRMHAALASGSREALASAVRKRFKAALIDEFQDTDPLQYEIFKRCFDGSCLFFIGDPKQAIYSFRGADIFTYKKAVKAVDKPMRHTLLNNWRSEPSLIEAVNDLFSPAWDPFVYPWISFRKARPARKKDRKVLRGPDGKHLVVWFAGALDGGALNKEDAQNLMCRAVASEISMLLNEAGQGRVRLGEEELRPFDIAVLVRTNVQARAVRDALKSCRIPCVLYSDENVFFSREAFEMEVLLFALSEPSSEGFLRAALMTRIFSLSAAKIDSLMEDEAGWEAWIERFRDYHDLWNRMGFTPMFRRLLDREDVRSRLLAGNNGERALTNVLHLAELLGRAEVAEKLGMRGLLKWLSERRDPEATESEEYQLRLESDDDAVRVMTVHKSKGLEFPVVFCPFAWASVKTGEKGGLLFHDDNGSPIIDLDPDRSGAHVIEAARETLAENVRLFYVSLTRAKNRCYMALGAIKGAETSAPAYLMRSNEVHGAGDLVKALQEAAPIDESMRQNLESLLEAGSGNAEVRDIPLELPMPLAQRESPEGVPEARVFSAAIDRTWGIASYSSFIAGLHRTMEPADRDALMLGMREGAEELNATVKDIFSFPRGARAGTLLHEVFERIDFTADDAAIRAVAEDTLTSHGFDRAWADVVTGMIRRVLDVDLGAGMRPDIRAHGDGPRLSGVENSERLTELEFFFPLKTITSKTLEAILVDCIPGHMPGGQQNQCHFDRREKSSSGEDKISRFARDDREIHSEDNTGSRAMFGDASSRRLSDVIVGDSDSLSGPSPSGKGREGVSAEHKASLDSSPPGIEAEGVSAEHKVSLDPSLLEKGGEDSNAGHKALLDPSPPGIGGEGRGEGDQDYTGRLPDQTVPSPLAGEGRGEGAEIPFPYRFPRLTFDPVKGFLRGFMDLVFRHEGRYYLIDWKSNHLGNSVIDYHQAALSRAMVENHYILQYHLYTVALHQYLKHRLEGYSYDDHFGGVFYVFLRGVDPEMGPEYGIFCARPDGEKIMQLAGVLLDV